MNIRIRPIPAALIVAGVAAVVLVWQFSHQHDQPTPRPAAAATNGLSGAAASTPAPDGHTTPTTPVAAPSATSSTVPADDDGDPGTARPANSRDLAAAQERGEEFAAAWLNTTNKTPEQWRASLTGYATTQVAADFADVDPGTVPVGTIGDPVVTTADGDGLAHVAVPITTGGTLILTVTLGTHPLVSDVDWRKP